MCGITGLAFADTDGRPNADLLARMCAALQHRGPDRSGGLIEAGIGLAMRRLSIIDVAGGHQPIFNEDHSVAVVFNGEIYNYHDLREQLVAQGHRFSTTSDTETIVHLYEQYGADFVDHLHGMFAIAIWDFRSQQLILARDRLGVKPLYYFQDQHRLSFGSEIKSLLQDSTVPRQMCTLAIHQLLTLGHILPPLTAFEGIRELPPASVLVYKSGQVDIHGYWDLNFRTANPFDEQRDIRDLKTRIKVAVARRLISEVPLGAFLSGGIDSGIVVAMMSQILPEPIKTFSIGFEDREFSELPFAALVAKHCRTDHHELIVQPNVPEIMDQLIAHHDAPFYDTSAIPTYYVSKFAREHVTVALSGDGGDEMFAGYNIYLANKAATQYQRIPAFLTRLFVEPLAHLVPESSTYLNKGRVVREFFRGASLGTLERYTRWATKIKRETRERLYYAAEMRSHLEVPDHSFLLPYFNTPISASELGRLLYVGTKTELPSDMLRKVDRMSMAHSLEVRSPFLDHALCEYAATLPDEAKLNGWKTKYALREIARSLLPAEVVDRPKRGFSIPLDRWLREDLKGYMQQILFDSRTEERGIFDNIAVRDIAAEHLTGRTARGRELWTLMTIEMWQRAYLDEFTHEVNNPTPLTLVSPASLTKDT